MASGYNHEVFMARLVDLPAELLLKIFAHVPNGQLKVLGLKCKKLAPIAQEFLFHTVTVAPRKRELRALKHVANHPALGLHVKHLAYDLSGYQYYSAGISDMDTYKHIRADHLELSYGSHKYTKLEYISGYKHTKNLINDEMAILRKNVISEVLAATLPSFRQLERVSCSFRYPGLSRFQGAPPLEPLTPKHEYDSRPKQNAEAAIRMMMRTANKVKASVTTFCLQPAVLPSEQDAIFPLPSKRSKVSALAFFSKLTTIHMRFGYHPWTINAQRSCVGARKVASITDGLVASQLLQNAKKLEHLSFGLVKIYSGMEVIIHFPLFLQFGDNFRWTQLRSLELENMFLYAEEFVDFIALHTNTLEEVRLTGMVFLSIEEWRKAIYCLENASLTHVWITTPLKLFKDGNVSTIVDIHHQNELLGGLSEKCQLAKKCHPCR